MMRFLVFLLVVAVIAWYGWQYTQRHSAESNSETATVEPGQSPPGANSGPKATPEPHDINTCRASLRKLALSLFHPIEQSKDFSEDNAEVALAQSRRELLQYSSEKDYGRLTQACAYLDQAIKDRAGFVKRSQTSSKGTTLDKVPGNWVSKDVSLDADPKANQSVDLSKANQAERSSFFQQAAFNGWRDRINYYAPTIDRLLTP